MYQCNLTCGMQSFGSVIGPRLLPRSRPLQQDKEDARRALRRRSSGLRLARWQGAFATRGICAQLETGADGNGHLLAACRGGVVAGDKGLQCVLLRQRQRPQRRLPERVGAQALPPQTRRRVFVQQRHDQVLEGGLACAHVAVDIYSMHA